MTEIEYEGEQERDDERTIAELFAEQVYVAIRDALDELPLDEVIADAVRAGTVEVLEDRASVIFGKLPELRARKKPD